MNRKCRIQVDETIESNDRHQPFESYESASLEYLLVHMRKFFHSIRKVLVRTTNFLLRISIFA